MREKAIQEFGRDVTLNSLRNRWWCLMNKYKNWVILKQLVGEGYDEATGTFNLTEPRWVEILEVLPETRRFKHDLQLGKKSVSPKIKTMMPEPDYRIPTVILDNVLASAPVGLLGLLLLFQLCRYHQRKEAVEEELNNMQNFHVLKQKELKNQWVYMKKQWQVWRGLINRTGHGYDPVSGELLGEDVWKVYPPTDYVPLPDDMNVDNTQVPHVKVNYPWEGEAIPSYDVPISPVREPTPGSTSHTPVAQVGVQTQSKEKRSATTVQPLDPTELVQSFISAFTAQGASSTSTNNNDTSSKVRKVLKDMVSSYEIDNALFFKSLKFLGRSNEYTYRLMFLGLSPEKRVSFLEALLR
ncbi:hypothetical protein GIB67_021252 [Kingdonia uniflora]|uniref:Myb/SANT-like domain-containing protein n=1 Tax=Kingdonia uniflora TaxID=39325 RepID=A0A7J7LFK3_9MAGN|nr:hypothetical protein GIB67_021252 [Kingdonia uniflora]